MDPIQPDPEMLPSGEDELSVAVREVYHEHWSAIRTHHHTGCVQDIYNYRLRDVNLNSVYAQ